MSGVTSKIPKEFKILSSDDRVSYVQALWDFIAETPDQVPIPESHKQIKTSGLVGGLSYQVFNVLGQTMKTDKLNNNSINLSNLSDNIYFIKITEIDTNKSLVKKIVLSK